MKSDIKAEDIKANIYDEIELIADIEGITNNDIVELENKWDELFNGQKYAKEKSEIYPSELEKYQTRNGLEYSRIKQKHILENESALRYGDKENTEEICICTKFVSFKLDYKIAHSLNESINLFSSIVEIFASNKFFMVKNLVLNKSDSVICSSKYRIFQCFEKNMFGDITYRLKEKSNLMALSCVNLFDYKTYQISVNKEVIQGKYDSQESYRGSLEIEVRAFYEDQGAGDVSKFAEIFHDMNEIAFEIFMVHITKSFANDLVLGKTNKVKEGFHENK